MPSLRTLVTSGLVAIAQATWFEDSANPQMKTPQARKIEDVLPGDAIVDRRQTQQNNTSIVSSNTIDMAQWDADTTKACMDALEKVTVATNPSGTSVCYNLMSLDSSPGSGKFMADMRLFQVSTPTGDFAGVPAADVAAKVAFASASVMLVSNSATNASANTQAKLMRRQTSAMPMLIRTYMLAGTIDPAKLAAQVDKGALEAWVTPTVTLAALGQLGQQATTQVTSNEAIFVNGIFANDVVLSDTARAQLAVDDVVAALKNGTSAFIVPGVNLLIEPIGLYITATWALIGFIIYGFGSYERYKHRDAYRLRMARLNGKGGQF